MTNKIPNIHTYLQFLNSINSFASYMYCTCYKKKGSHFTVYTLTHQNIVVTKSIQFKSHNDTCLNTIHKVHYKVSINFLYYGSHCRSSLGARSERSGLSSSLFSPLFSGVLRYFF